jgi:hypothetical protein
MIVIRSTVRAFRVLQQGFIQAHRVLLLSLSGCAAVVLTGAGVGGSYTLTNVAYRTFSFPLDQTHHAIIDSLKQMDISIFDDSKLEEARSRSAATQELRIAIKLLRVTSKTT